MPKATQRAKLNDEELQFITDHLYMSDQLIAQEINCAPGTVKHHKRNIRRQLQGSNDAAIRRIALGFRS